MAHAVFLALLAALLALTLVGGDWGYRRFGDAGYAPAALLLLALIILTLAGAFRP